MEVRQDIMHGKRTAVEKISLLLALFIILTTMTARSIRSDMDDDVLSARMVHEVPSRSLPVHIPLDIAIPDQNPHYIIICPEEFKEEVGPLAVHRTITGLPSRIYTLESIITNYTGMDDQQRVHNFLRELHDLYPTFKWLLIMADSEHLEPRLLWHYASSKGQPFGNNYSSDVYYAGLDSDWNDDGDDRFGEFLTFGNLEADLDWDIFVGRVPSSSESDAANYTQKLIRYERNPPLGAWMKRFLNWGSLMEPPNRDYDPNRYFEHKSNAYKVCMRVQNNLSEHLEVSSLFDYPQIEGGNYTPYDGRDTLTRANMLSQLNNGASMLNFVGQARYEAYALNDYGPPTGFGDEWSWNEPLRYSDADIFANQDMMPFMYASTCDSAKFFNTSREYNDKSLEKWLTSASGGIIGLISSTGTSARGEEQTRSWGNWYLDEQFWRLFLEEGITRPGRNLYLLKELYEDKWFTRSNEVKETILGMLYTYILLGDPYVDVYTDIAGRFERSDDLDIDLYTGSRMTRFRVLDREGDPVRYPEITLYNKDIYICHTGTADGWINKTMDLGESTSINITLNAHNMVPSFYQVSIEPAIADISIKGSDLSSVPDHPVPGDLALFQLDLRNIGGMDASGVQMTVEVVGGSGDPTYFLEHFDIGSLPAGSMITLEWNWTLRFGTHTMNIIAISSSRDLDPENQMITRTFTNPGPQLLFFPGTGLISPGPLMPPSKQAYIDIDIFNNGTAPSVVDIQLYLGDPSEDGMEIGEVYMVGPVPSGGWSNVSIPFLTPLDTGMIYIVMDPYGKIPPDMTSLPVRSLIVIDHSPVRTKNLTFAIMEDSKNNALRIDDSVIDDETESGSLEYDLEWRGPLDLWIAQKGNRTYLNCVPGPDVHGVFKGNVTVSDGLSTIRVPFQIEVVEVNDPPRFLDSVGGRIELTTLEDSMMVLDIGVTDVEGDEIELIAVEAPFNISIDGNSIEWKPEQSDVGSNEFTIIARDERGASSEMMLLINVVEVNDPPIVKPIADIILNLSDFLEIQIEVHDEEGDDMTYSSSNSLLDIGRDGMASFNQTKEHIGTTLVTISVSDGINTVILEFNVTIIDDITDDVDDRTGVLSSTVAAAAVAAALFIFLLLGFMFLRRGRSDDEVLRELEDADEMYREDLTEE